MVLILILIVVAAAMWWIKQAYDDPMVVDRIEQVSISRLRDAKAYARLMTRSSGSDGAQNAEAKLAAIDAELRRRAAERRTR